MRIDPAVSRTKFDAEVAQVERQREVLRGWGCFLLRVEYPTVDTVYVPRKFMKLTFPVASQGSIIALPSVAHATVEIPVLAARAFGVRVSLDDYDQRAPSVTFHDPWTWQPLRPDQIPLGQTLDENGRAQLVVLNEHPDTHKPFLCMRGIREYHEHPQHTGDEWALYRGDIGLFSVLSLVWRTCVDLARPNLIFAAAGRVQLQWEAEPPRTS